MASETEMGQTEKPVYKKIIEYKKKISLVEGKRRAMYNKFEQEKNVNKDRQTEIDHILKETEHDFIQSQTTKEILLRKVSGKPNLDRKLLQRLSPTSALSSLDYKVSDLQNKFNKLKFKSQKKSEYLRVLNVEAEKNAIKKDYIPEFSKEEQRQRFLENEIHKTGLKMMEADMVRKKYDIILDMLKQERTGYISQIEILEDNWESQNTDVGRLDGEYKEACVYRDTERAELKEKELKFACEAKERERSVLESKRVMKERRELFRGVDHLLMGSTSSRHEISSSVTDSMIRDEDKMEQEGEFNKQEFQEFEEAFARMKKAAGVSEIDEVINRFRTQNKTASILEGQMRLAETDVRTLGELKESLYKEWEQVRYLGQDEDIKIRDKFEEMELDMEEINERMVKTTGKLEVLGGNHDLVKRKLSRMASIIEEKLQNDMDDIGFKPSGLDLEEDYKEQEEQRKKRKDIEEDGPDDDEVPTRETLMRQSELLVNAKQGPKKGGRRKI